jgi:hypothetical protein
MSERRLLLRALPAGLAVLFVLTLVPTPVAANPSVPYCAGSINPLGGTVPGIIMPEVCEQVSGRVFPEASALSVAQSPYALPGASVTPVLDYISYYEFQAGLDYLAASEMGQQYLTVHEVAQSYGLCPTPACADGDRVHFPIYMLELTNKATVQEIPLENRQAMLFMLSIHGNEKGGREGGFRILEDLVKGIGFAAEGVQDGAGLPTAITTSNGDVQTYHDYLDFMRIFLLFPNADGWAHDETPFVASEADMCGTLFCRTNGHGTDLNRQGPTAGWQNPNRNVVGEPESIGYYNWMLQQDITWSYAIDIHGMLNHQNFGAIMLPAGAMTPQEMQRSIRLAETLKDRLNTDSHFDGWRNLFAAGESGEGVATDALQDNGQCVDQGLPLGSAAGTCEGALNAVGSSQFAEYYTVIDAIGYTDSGFNGDYFAQDSGLNAPGYDIELAYNHITTDSQYEGPGSVFNDFHVKMVREIVKSYMDAAALDVKISFETQGLRTAYVEPTFVATSADDANPKPGGWADENPGDDLWDYGANGGFAARPASYWEDLKPFVRDGEEPGVLAKLTPSSITASQLAQFDQLVIPGSAIRDLEGDQGSIDAIKAWVEAGGNLVLTDEALRFLDLSGITNDAVDVHNYYMGGIGITDLTLPVFHEYQDASSEANRNVRGGVKQMYEPTPLGFETGANAAPNWFVAEGKFSGDVWGYACGTTSITDRCAASGEVGLGRLAVGEGQVQFLGSLLPDPTEEFYHPYGLDPYATTYSGNQILRNMLFLGNVIRTPPVILTADGEIVQSENEPTAPADAATVDEKDDKDTPAVGPIALLGALAAVAVALRRRR